MQFLYDFSQNLSTLTDLVNTMKTNHLVLYGGTWRDAAVTLPLKAWSRTSASGLRYVPCGYTAGMPTSALSCLYMTQSYPYVDLVFVPTGNITVTAVCMQPLWSNSISEMPYCNTVQTAALAAGAVSANSDYRFETHYNSASRSYLQHTSHWCWQVTGCLITLENEIHRTFYEAWHVRDEN